MKAFVKVRNGNFPDVNYYTAWKGFVEIGYEVVKFEEDQEGTIDVSPETPVFAGVGLCRKIIKRVWGWDYTGINPYPDELKPFMYRNYERKKWKDARQEALEGHKFIKPVIQKQFTGVVLSTLLDTIRTGKVDEENEVYVCDMVEFVSEFRVYVHEHEIVGVKHYHGDWANTPQEVDLQTMVKAYKPSAPIAYGLDVGIIYDRTGMVEGQGLYGKGPFKTAALVEINDGICLGNYGLDTIHYAEMIASRWLELTRSK